MTKVIYTRSPELLLLSSSNPSLELQNAKIEKASKGEFSQSLYFTDEETKAWKW